MGRGGMRRFRPAPGRTDTRVRDLPSPGEFSGLKRGASLAIALMLVLGGASRADTLPVPDGTRDGALAAPGSLRGTVRLSPRLAARRIRFSLYPDPAAEAPAPVERSLSDELANVVVYLENAPALADAAVTPQATFRMEQRGESFVPHVLPVIVGSTVEFPNGDEIYHNVFSLSKTASFDLGRYPKGASRAVRFDRPGLVKVFCHIHSDMSAVVMVLEHGFFSVPDAGGEFTIPGIPPGRYSVTGWHERARPIRREIVIEPGRQSDLFLAIPIEEIADDR